MFHRNLNCNIFVFKLKYCSKGKNNINRGRHTMHEYVFKMKKGDIEIELKSDDIEFVEEQLNKWRADIMQK